MVTFSIHTENIVQKYHYHKNITNNNWMQDLLKTFCTFLLYNLFLKKMETVSKNVTFMAWDAEKQHNPIQDSTIKWCYRSC